MWKAPSSSSRPLLRGTGTWSTSFYTSETRNILITGTVGQAGGSVWGALYIDGAYCPGQVGSTNPVSSGGWSVGAVQVCMAQVGPGTHTVSLSPGACCGSGLGGYVSFTAF